MPIDTTVAQSGLDVNSVWSTDDFNGDGRTNSSDLVAALADPFPRRLRPRHKTCQPARERLR
jgi:hypothetical protein